MKTKQTIVKQIILCLGLFLSAGAFTPKAAAGNDTWNGAGADNNWSTAANWSPASANRPPAAGDVLFFDGTSRLNAVNDLSAANSVVGGIQFNPTAGAFTLSGNTVTNNGGTTVKSPSLQTMTCQMALPSSHSVNAVAGGTLLLGGVISGAGGVQINNAAGGYSGTVIFTNNNTYTGTTLVSAGTLKLDYNAANAANNIVSSSSALSLGGGTLLINGNSSSASSQTFASAAFTTGSSVISAAPASGANNPTLTLGALTDSSGASVELIGPAYNSGASSGSTMGGTTVPATATISTTSTGSPLTQSGGGYATVNLYDWAAVSGGSIVGASQVAGFYTMVAAGGKSTAANLDVTGTTASTTSTATITSIRLNAAGAMTLNTGSTAGSLLCFGGLLETPNVGANNVSVAGFFEVSRSTSARLDIWQNNTLGYMQIIGQYLDSKSALGILVKNGAGTLTLAASQAYTGQTFLNNGVTIITADSCLGAAATGAQINMNGGTLLGDATFALDNAGANKRNFVLNNLGGTLAATPANTMTNSGVISGSGSLAIGVNVIPGTGAGTANTTAVTGNGTVVLSGADTYTGNTFINFGTLALASTGSINSTPQIYTATNAVLDVSAVTGFTLGGSQSLAGFGTNNGSITASSGSIIYAGTDGGYGTNTFNNNLTNASGSLVYLDLGTVYNGINDLINVGGTLALNSTTFHLKAPSAAANLDTTADYVLMNAASIVGTPNSSPVWDIQPANYANFIVTVSGTSVVLHYSVAAPPSGTGNANPNPANRNQSVRFVVNATPGSSPISTVVLDASLIGGSSSVTLVQSNGTSIYTNTVTVSAGTVPGAKSLPATITDTGALSSVVNIALTVINTQTWIGAGANDNWSTGADWVSGVSPVAGDLVTFAGTTRPTPAMDTDNNLTGVAFNNTAGSFTLGTPGSTLTLTADGIVNNSANPQTVNLPVSLTAAQTFNAASGNLIISQAITNGGNLVSFDGSFTNLVGGAITGAGGLTKNGSGTLTLTGANTYSGNTTTAAGILEVTNNGVISGGTANISAVSSAEMLVDGGSVTATSGNVGTPSTGLYVTAGSVNYLGALSMDLGNNNNSVINVAGGTVASSSLSLGRTALSNTTQPGSGSTSLGLYIHGGAVIVTNNLNMGTTSAANSSVNTRMDSGSLSVGGVLTIGLINSGRWSDLDITGGTLTVNDTTTGISIGGPYSGNAVMLMRGGTATAGKISFGQATVGSTNMTAVLNQTGGSLYIGSGGLAQVSTGAGFVSTVTLSGGTLGAAADWSSTLNMSLGGSPTLKAADLAGTPHNIALSGVLSGGGSLTKTGNGTLALSAVDTYSGVTAINAGTLALTIDGVTSAVGSINNSTTITVATNAVFDVSGINGAGGFVLGNGKTIAGLGTVTGTFAAMDGSSVSPAGLGAQGQLNFATGLTANNMTFKLELSSDPTGIIYSNDSVNITGDFTSTGLNNIVVTPVGSLGLGTYKLIKYSGSFVGDLSTLACVAGTLTNPPGEIDLIVTSVRPVAGLVWHGDGVTDLWDTAGSSNWLNGASLDRFYTGDTNVFDDSAISYTVNLSGPLVPASAAVVLVNATHDYTFNAGGSISGSTGLTKTNTGKLTILGDNDYTGVTTINGGTLSATTLAVGGTACSIGAASVSAANLVLNGGTLEYLGANKTIDRGATLQNNGGALSVVGGTTLTLSGALTGPGSLTKTGNGQITLNGGNNYVGGTLITDGTIRGNPASALGTNTLTLNGVTSATFLFSGDSQVMGNVLNVVGVNNYLANNGNDTLNRVTGTGTVNLNGNSGNQLTLQAIDSTGFNGTFSLNTLPTLRFFPTSGTTLNASNATFNLAVSGGQINNRDGGNYSLGALSGVAGTFLRGSGNSGSATTTYTIGGNNADSDFSGVIATGTGGTGARVNLVKVGSGRLTLSGANTYNGATTVNYGVLALGDGSTDGSINNSTPITLSSNTVLDVSLRTDGALQLGGTATQLLTGNGVIHGLLNVGGSGTVTPGDAVSLIGRLTVTNAVTLGGTAAMKLNRTNSPNCDLLISSNSLACGGTLSVVNVGNPLQLGDSFTLFSAAGGISGSFAQTNLPALGGGLGWTWNPATAQLTVVQTVNLNPTNVIVAVSGSTLFLSWPADHLGWHLEMQTNNLYSGVSANPADWMVVPGTSGIISTNLTIDPALPAGFYRLVSP